MCHRVGVHVGREEAVVPERADGAVQQRIDGEREGLFRLVGHLRRRLVDIDHGAVDLGEPHRHA